MKGTTLWIYCKDDSNIIRHDGTTCTKYTYFIVTCVVKLIYITDLRRRSNIDLIYRGRDRFREESLVYNLCGRVGGVVAHIVIGTHVT